MPTRRLAIAKRVSLAEVAEGWQDCYGIVSQLSYLERSEIIDTKPNFKTEVEATHYMNDLVKKHIVTGKVMAFNEDGSEETVDLTSEDIDGSASRELVEILFNAILGVSENPKASSTPTETSSTLAPTTAPLESTNSTKTQ